MDQANATMLSHDELGTRNRISANQGFFAKPDFQSFRAHLTAPVLHSQSVDTRGGNNPQGRRLYFISPLIWQTVYMVLALGTCQIFYPSGVSLSGQIKPLSHAAQYKVACCMP